MAERIVIVDDEKEIADVIELYLKNEGYEVFKFYNGMDTLACLEKQEVDLAILDVMLPDVDGFTILQKIREVHKFPVIMLTAKSEYIDKITGLTLGADDYIAKPFNPLELIARVKAQLRRFTQYNEERRPAENVIDFAGLVLNKDTHECVYNEKELVLTPIEFNILWILCENRGQVISSEKLFEQVWGEKYFKNSNNTVMVHIRHLREKMSDTTGRTDFIKTVWGVGYKIEK
ncbi:MAG: VanR-ABDEGLN family response regulator transcription factor [Lachnospiraceae bacterium]|nr:VanR-ABDEGLN family response regulator transcription factor [Oscillospiraceae bacterium]MDY5540512.1 VanR-ABDEGLN family response regulator transcription factor [Lachnospiraceae bacterium]